MKRFLLIVIAAACMAAPAAAQLEESIVVTGSRISEPIPGVFLTRNGDFLLLPVSVVNDSRDEKQREDEIYKTLLRMLEKAGRDGALELSVVDGDFVRPLTKENHRIELSKDGNRPDTSRVEIHVSLPVTGKGKPGALIDKVRAFVTGTAVVGRTVLLPDTEVEVSIVNPNQYRDEIIDLVVKDIKRVTTALGEGYRIRLRGIDRPAKWVRSGLSEVTLYIPYSYEVVPAAEAYFFNESRLEE